MTKEISGAPEIPDYDRKKLLDFLNQSRFQQALRGVISRTGQGFEQGLLEMVDPKTGQLSLKMPKDVEATSVHFEGIVTGRLKPLINLHTHPLESSGFSFLPSVTDLQGADWAIDYNREQILNIVAAIIF